MNPLYTAYRFLASSFFLTFFPPFWLFSRVSGRYKNGLHERLGFVPRTLVKKTAKGIRIWIHAASLGEVTVAEPIIDHLRRLLPDCDLVLSSVTEHGRELAEKTFADPISIIYAPIDTVFSVRTALSRIHPKVMVFLETELWPNWITEAHRMGIKTVLVNGRISSRSVQQYARLRPFFREVLRHVDAFSMIRDEDADRIKTMGAESTKIKINGNSKFDLMIKQADNTAETEIRSILNISPSQNVMVAGSTRGGEEPMVLDAFEKILTRYPDTVLIIAPRHINRTTDIAALVKGRGHECQLRTDFNDRSARRTAPVVILNSYGELQRVYSIGTINFCGASLVPLGGQNPLEAGIWGKVVFYGPSMGDFLDAKALLEEAGAGIQIDSADDLAEKALWYLGHPEKLVAGGAKVRQAILKSRGAAGRHAKVIYDLL